MPFRSKAQWKACFAQRARGQTDWDCDEWAQGVDYSSLPETVEEVKVKASRKVKSRKGSRKSRQGKKSRKSSRKSRQGKKSRQGSRKSRQGKKSRQGSRKSRKSSRRKSRKSRS